MNLAARIDLTLERLGWDDAWNEAFAPHAEQALEPARVAVQHRGAYVLYAPDEVWAEAAGRLAHDAGSPADLPAAGDWVAVARAPSGDGHATIHAVLPRRTKLTRKAAWSATEEQVLAANIDTVLVLTSVTDDLNLRRLERYLTMAWESGARTAVVLTKADALNDVRGSVAEVEAVALGVPVHAVSSLTGAGLDELDPYLGRNQTVVLVGSSGVGKSTLVNTLAGEELLAVQEVREDGRGRHTTTRRELVPLPQGALVLDTPGIRELQLWADADGLEAAFADIGALAEGCRFADCAHRHEPGCAVLEALVTGELTAERLDSYRKLERELKALALRQDQRARAEARKERRRFARSQRKPAW